MPSVFISYSSHDRKTVKDIAAELRKHGVRVWIDQAQIKVGQAIKRRITDGIESTDFLLIAISKKSMESHWVEEELQTARYRAIQDQTDTVLPILLDRVEVPRELRHLKYADFTSSFDEGLAQLLEVFDLNEDEIAFLSRDERIRKIDSLLREVGRNGDLPKGLLELFEDESYLAALERKLAAETPRRELLNAVNTVRQLAEGWGGAPIRSHSTVPLLIRLYKESDDPEIREPAAEALVSIGTMAAYRFVTKCLDSASPKIRASILGGLQFVVDRSMNAEWVRNDLLPLLHEFCALPQEECMYFDEFDGEEDFRFWVFRCLGAIRNPTSAQVIDRFIAGTNWPLTTLAEAANAHWDITHTTRHIGILRRAKAEHALGNTEHALKEMEAFERKRRSTPAKRKKARSDA